MDVKQPCPMNHNLIAWLEDLGVHALVDFLRKAGLADNTSPATEAMASVATEDVPGVAT